MLEKIVAFSLILVPSICWMGFGEGIRAPKEIASVLCLATITIFGFSKIKVNKWFLGFFGWCCLTLLLSNHLIPVFTKNGVVNLPSPMIAYKSLFYIALAILAISSLGNINLKKIAKVLSWVCIGMCVFTFIQLLGFDEWFTVADPNTGWVGKSIWTGDIQGSGHFSRRLVGTVGNPSILAIFLALCIPYLIYHGKKLGIIAAILSFIVVGLCISLTAYLALACSMLFLLFFKNKKIFILVLTLLILAGVFSYNKAKFMYNPTGRIEVLKESFNFVYKKAITGFGLGTWEYMIGLNPEVVQKLGNQNWRETHSEYWQLWFETGLIGLFLFLTGCVVTFWNFLKSISRETLYLMASLIVFLVSSISYFPMRVAPLSYLGVITFGLLINKIGEKNG